MKPGTYPLADGRRLVIRPVTSLVATIAEPDVDVDAADMPWVHVDGMTATLLELVLDGYADARFAADGGLEFRMTDAGSDWVRNLRRRHGATDE